MDKERMAAGQVHSDEEIDRILEELERRDWLDRAGMVENCGLPGERVFSSLKEKPESSGYFTTIILP